MLVSIALSVHSQTADSAKEMQIQKIKITGYPAASYAPETSLALGAAGFLVFNIEDSDTEKAHRPSSISPYFLLTFNKQFLSAIDLELYLNKGYTFNSTFRYFNYPDYFYGIGGNTDAFRQLFTNKYFKWEGSIFRSLDANIFYGLQFEWSNNRLSNFDTGNQMLTANVTGYSGGNLIGMGPVFRFDNRNDIFYPTRGFFAESGWLIFPDLPFNDYSYNSFKLDIRAYHKVFSEKNILALQLYYQQATGNSVPFYKLPQLGGDNRLRGIEHENRYRDQHAFYFQVEGRQELFWRLGGVLFAGLGNVAERFSGPLFRNLKFIYGLGGRFRPFKDEKLNLRLDIGKGPDSQYGIYFSIREAF